jgi:PAS domain S-box-containing protein
MSESNKDPRTRAQLLEEIEQLRLRLEEAEETLEAIRHGDIDALVVTGPQDEQIFTLAGAEHVYRVIVETMNEAGLTVDPDGTILFCNQRFCDLMKTPIQEAMGHKATAFVARPQQPPLKALLTDAQAGPVQRRLTLRAGDGTAVPVQISASLLQAGDSASICLVASDLTELEASANSIRVLREHEQAMQEANEHLQMQTEELQSQSEELQTQTEELRVQTGELASANTALRQSEVQYRELVQNANSAIIRWKRDGTLTFFNEYAQAFFGYSEKEAIGRHVNFLVPPQDSTGANLTKLAQEVVEHPERYASSINENVCRDGRRVWMAWTNKPILNEQGQVMEMLAVGTDITERKRAEEALRDLNTTLENRVFQRTAELQHRARQLQKLTLELSETEDRERRQLAEILHDDLQQQLAAAKFHLSLLNNRAKHDPSQQALITQVDQMLMDAIQKSRSLSHELSPAVLYHGDFAGALGWLAGQVHTKHGLEVTVDAFGEVRIESDAIKSFLYKAAQEMLFNAVKHARVNKARIRVRRLGRYICLSVSDQGRGFDPQELRQTTGFGLLSIRERIELLGGRMKMRSAKGEGSTFHIMVPDGPTMEDGFARVEGLGGVRSAPSGAGAASAPPRLRVLLADDHEIVREGLISLLSDERDIQVVGEAANGREAVDQAYRLQPDVVIMDVAMPLINGDDATRQIKRHLPKTRVIALSMYEEADMVEKMYRAGAESYVLKTAPTEQLLAAIRGKTTQA